MRTDPVKYSAGPFCEGCVPARAMESETTAAAATMVISFAPAAPCSEQLVGRDRQFADAPAGGMEDCACNRRRDSHHRDLAKPLHPEGVDVRVVLLDEDHVHHRWTVSVDGHRVFGEVGVRNAPAAGVHHRMLHERHADTADHATDALAATRFWVDDTASTVRADDAPHARLPEIWIDRNFHDDSAEGMHPESLARGSRFDVSGGL